MVYVGTKSKISLLLVVIGVCSVSGYELDEKVEKNFPEDMKNYARALVTDIYQPGEGLGYMAKMIKKGRVVVTVNIRTKKYHKTYLTLKIQSKPTVTILP